MTEFLTSLYPWTKAFHIISVISWMAGIFYLPRMFVHHVEQCQPGDEKDQMLQMMERKLFRMIMNPANDCNLGFWADVGIDARNCRLGCDMALF